MEAALTLDRLYNNRFCQYVHDHNRFYDVVFNDLIAKIRQAGSEENLIHAKGAGHIFYDDEPLYDYDIVTMSLYGIRYSEFKSYLKGIENYEIEEYLKKLRKEALEAISYVELEFYTKNNVKYECEVFYYMRPKQNKYSDDDIKEIQNWGFTTSDRIKAVV